jgi:hypothetical protein
LNQTQLHPDITKFGRGKRTRTSSALKLPFPKRVGYHLPIYTPKLTQPGLKH